MRFIRPSVARAQARAAEEARVADQGRIAALEQAAQRYEGTLLAIKDVVNGVKVPNGTTKRVARLVNEVIGE